MSERREEERGRTGFSMKKNHNSNFNRRNQEQIHQKLPTKISGPLTLEQLFAYQHMFRIQEISSIIKSHNFEIPNARNRSPSPPPVYDAEGKRINTREQLYKKKLMNERFKLVEVVSKLIPGYSAPKDYKRPTTFQEKYYIPVSQYPQINFVGLLLGPRGKTLRKMQEDSGCKIAIRGRGSVKEGKTSSDLPPGAMDFSDPLHCLIIADNEEKIENGIKACRNIVIKAVTSPEGQNELKRGQLRELAELNGTLREDNRPCATCGQQGHKKYECPHRETFAMKIICRRCNQPGHTIRDCTSDSNYGQQIHSSRYNNEMPYQRTSTAVDQPSAYSRYGYTPRNHNGSSRFNDNSKYLNNGNKRATPQPDLELETSHKRQQINPTSSSQDTLSHQTNHMTMTTIEDSGIDKLQLPAGMSNENPIPQPVNFNEIQINDVSGPNGTLEAPPGLDLGNNDSNITLQGPPGLN